MNEKLLSLLSVLIWINAAVANNSDILLENDCDEIKNGILYLLSVADGNWKGLDSNPEGTPDHLDHTLRIKWVTDVAANYTTIHKAFCDQRK